MPVREEKHSILPSRHAELKEHGLFAALEAIKDLNSTTLPIENVAHQISGRIRSTIKAACVSLWLVDDLHKFIALQAFSCLESNDANPKKYNINIDDEDSPVAACLRESKASLHKKLTLSEMDPRAATLTKTYVSAVLPLLSPAGAIGVFEVLTAANDGINKAELESLEVLAAQVALLLSNHQHTDHVSRQSALQKQLYEITAKIHQAKDYTSILQITAEELCAALNLPAAAMHVNMAVEAKPAASKERSA